MSWKWCQSVIQFFIFCEGPFMLSCIGLYSFLLLILLHPFPAVDRFLEVKQSSFVKLNQYYFFYFFLTVPAFAPRSCVFPKTGASPLLSLWWWMQPCLSSLRYSTVLRYPLCDWSLYVLFRGVKKGQCMIYLFIFFKSVTESKLLLTNVSYESPLVVSVWFHFCLSALLP